MNTEYTHFSLSVVPTTRAEAQAFVELHHRHHGAPLVAVFRVAIADETGKVRGVAIVGRPVARQLVDGWTLEVNRCCTDGVKNGCSMLYGAAWRAARALGYRRLVTYTASSEPGTSLVAAGWTVVAQTKAESWNRKARPRVDTTPLQSKFRWEKVAG